MTIQELRTAKEDMEREMLAAISKDTYNFYTATGLMPRSINAHFAENTIIGQRDYHRFVTDVTSEVSL